MDFEQRTPIAKRRRYVGLYVQIDLAEIEARVREVPAGVECHWIEFSTGWTIDPDPQDPTRFVLTMPTR